MHDNQEQDCGSGFPDRLPPLGAGGRGDGAAPSAGGQTSNSPPSKVKPLSELLPRFLASGIDTLYLAIDIEWASPSFFAYLDNLKQKAIEADSEVAGKMADWPFVMRPFGRRGYEWLLDGAEYSFRVGDWEKPQSRPSVMLEIRSETLWHHGPRVAVERALSLLQAVSGFDLSRPTIKTVKLSRVDLCTDFLFHQDLWRPELLDAIVCRATNIKQFQKNSLFTGFVVGTGSILARLYDKGTEIKTVSKKFWMYDIWGLTEMPAEHRAVRVEFQLGREVIKELGIGTPDDLFRQESNVWAYCTQNWLKFQDRPGCHHNQRSVLSWWIVVQCSFKGAQAASPLIRHKIFNGKIEQLYRQAYGLLSSITALHQESCEVEPDARADLNDCYQALFEATGMVDGKCDFSDRVQLKRARYHRAKERTEDVLQWRREKEFEQSLSETNKQGDDDGKE